MNLNNAQLLRGLFETVSSSIDKLSSLQKRLGYSVKIIDDSVIPSPTLRSPASTSPSTARDSTSRLLTASSQSSSSPSTSSPGAATRAALESQLRPEERPSPPQAPHGSAHPKRP